LFLYSHAAVEVHAVDTNCRVVLDAEIDVLRDAEAEVASVGEVLLAQLVFLDFQATLENLLCFGTTDGDMHGDLLVTTDTEGSDGVAGLAWRRVSMINDPWFHVAMLMEFSQKEALRGAARTVDWRLTRQLLKNFGSTSETITRFADGNVQDEFVNFQLPHRVRALVVAFRHLEMVGLTIATE
jgi:hypothetical protein